MTQPRVGCLASRLGTAWFRVYLGVFGMVMGGSMNPLDCNSRTCYILHRGGGEVPITRQWASLRLPLLVRLSRLRPIGATDAQI